MRERLLELRLKKYDIIDLFSTKSIWVNSVNWHIILVTVGVL